MDDSAQNIPVSNPSISQPPASTDDDLAKLQAQVTALQNQKQQEEKEEAKNLQSKIAQNNSTSNSNDQTDDSSLVSDDEASEEADDQGQDIISLTKQPQGQVQTQVREDKANKERKDQIIGSPTPEKVPYREVQAEFQPPKELEQWMEKKPDPQTITLPKPVKDEYGDILVQASQIPVPNIILPMDEEEIKKGLQSKVIDSIRWLAEWCKRNILVYPKRVFFKKNTETTKPITT